MFYDGVDQVAEIPYEFTSQISARNGGSLLFVDFNELHISEFRLPNVRSSVRMDKNFAKSIIGRGRWFMTYACKVSRKISWIFSTLKLSTNPGRSVE